MTPNHYQASPSQERRSSPSVVVRSRSVGVLNATAESKPDRVLLQCCLRFQRWRNLRWGRCTQHQVRLSLRVAKGESRRLPRPRNSCVPSCRPPHGERRRRSASVSCRLGEGAAPQRTRGARPDRAWTSHQALMAAGPVAHDREARCARWRTLTSRSRRARSRWFDLGVWLVHARSG